MSETLKIIGIAIGSLWAFVFMFLGSFISIYLNEKNLFNNGICKESGEAWILKHEHNGTRYYEDSGNNFCRITTFVDRKWQSLYNL